MPEKDQIYIFTNDELSLIKNTFSENDILLHTIRKALLQFELTEVEKGLIRTSVTPEVLNVLRKRILPDLSPAFPIGQLSSILTTLTNDIRTKGVDDMEPLFKAKQIEIDYLQQQLRFLEDLEAETPIKLFDLGRLKGKDAEDAYVDTTAYLFLLGYIDPMMAMIKQIAGKKEETLEEQKKRMFRDSSK